MGSFIRLSGAVIDNPEARLLHDFPWGDTSVHPVQWWSAADQPPTGGPVGVYWPNRIAGGRAGITATTNRPPTTTITSVLDGRTIPAVDYMAAPTAGAGMGVDTISFPDGATVALLLGGRGGWWRIADIMGRRIQYDGNNGWLLSSTDSLTQQVQITKATVPGPSGATDEPIMVIGSIAPDGQSTLYVTRSGPEAYATGPTVAGAVTTQFRAAGTGVTSTKGFKLADVAIWPAPLSAQEIKDVVVPAGRRNFGMP